VGQTHQKAAEADAISRGYIEEDVPDEEHAASVLKII